MQDCGCVSSPYYAKGLCYSALPYTASRLFFHTYTKQFFFTHSGGIKLGKWESPNSDKMQSVPLPWYRTIIIFLPWYTVPDMYVYYTNLVCTPLHTYSPSSLVLGWVVIVRVDYKQSGAKIWIRVGEKSNLKTEKELYCVLIRVGMYKKYQPSGDGGTRSPPATPHRLQRRTACNTPPPA